MSEQQKYEPLSEAELAGVESVVGNPRWMADKSWREVLKEREALFNEHTSMDMDTHRTKA